ncbi:MAG TPA: flagellar basal-body MS-ring/collar protein FliF [Caulobacteraceae bacterium]|jgi:flagellar M-ring protein FliF|nr:flagellar basal-body MS-ring/collar protein FliF [Caulobacteraceae bacterium]
MTLIERITFNGSNRKVWVAAVVGLVLFAGLAAGYVFVFHKPYAVLFSDLRTLDAGAVVADLDKRKVPYHLKDGGATILVPADRVDATRLAILSGELPLKGVVGFELFNKSDLGLTEFAQKINYQRALQGELARTIMAIDGIDSARVHLSMPEPSIFRDDRRPPKASVALIMHQGANLAPPAVLGIQRLVAAAVPDLDSSNVVILDDRGNIVSAQTALARAESEQQRSTEQAFEDKVRIALEQALPGHSFEISVVTPASVGSDDAAGASTATANESGNEASPPDNRTFPVKVSVSSPLPLDVKLAETVRRVAGDAIALDPARGDEVKVIQALSDAAVADEPGLKPVAPLTAMTPPAGLQARGLSPTNFWLAVLALTLVGMALVAIWLGRQSGRTKALTDAKRQDYVRRLTQLVNAEDLDVVHRS